MTAGSSEASPYGTVFYILIVCQSTHVRLPRQTRQLPFDASKPLDWTPALLPYSLHGTARSRVRVLHHLAAVCTLPACVQIVAGEVARIKDLLRAGGGRNGTWVAPPGDTAPDLWTDHEPFMLADTWERPLPPPLPPRPPRSPARIGGRRSRLGGLGDGAVLQGGSA